MTLKASNAPSGYEGEMACTINWLQEESGEKIPTGEQYLYLRIKKQPMLKAITKMKLELEEDQPLMEDILTGMIKEIMIDPSLEEMVRRIEDQPTSMYTDINNCEPPGISYLSNELVEDDKIEELYDEYAKDTNMEEGKDFGRKLVFLNEGYVRLTEAILDNTLFNIVQEATHGECDLMKAPRTYITKK